VNRDRPGHNDLRPDPDASRTYSAIFPTHDEPARLSIADVKSLAG